MTAASRLRKISAIASYICDTAGTFAVGAALFFFLIFMLSPDGGGRQTGMQLAESHNINERRLHNRVAEGSDTNDRSKATRAERDDSLPKVVAAGDDVPEEAFALNREAIVVKAKHPSIAGFTIPTHGARTMAIGGQGFHFNKAALARLNDEGLDFCQYRYLFARISPQRSAFRTLGRGSHTCLTPSTTFPRWRLASTCTCMPPSPPASIAFTTRSSRTR